MSVTAHIAACRDALVHGEVVLVPTDTVYGVAAALADEQAIAHMYALKGRPRSQPCQVLCFSADALAAVTGHLSAATRDLLHDLLPGTTTCIVSDPAGRFGAAGGNDPTSVGIRAPKMPPVFADLDMLLVATSANDPGGPDPRTIADVPEHLLSRIGAVVDIGELPGVASAVVDLRTPERATLLRPGPDPAKLTMVLAAHGLGVDPL